MTGLVHALGILRETKNRWERRVPIVPSDVAVLVAAGVPVRVERSATRTIPDGDYATAGATLVDDAGDCRMLVGVKEVAAARVRAGQTVLCFSHTIKGQAHNMPLLARFLAVGASLVDYEAIVDDQGVRQVAFGRYAGLAGAHETLWTLGHRAAALGHPNALSSLRHAVEHPSLADMVASTRAALGVLAAAPDVPALSPFVVAVTGSGRVSLGALEYLDAVGGQRLSPRDAVAWREQHRPARTLGILHLTGNDLYARAGRVYDVQDYLAHPEAYVCVGSMYLPHVRAVVNGLYWDARFPRLLDDSTLRRMHRDGTLPTVLGDVACDLGGGIAWTVQATAPDAPAFVYDPATDSARQGLDGPGVAIMAVDNLPCALPRDASEDFSRALTPYLRPCFEASLGEGDLSGLPAAVQPAVIVAGGRLTARHAGLARHLGPTG